LLQLTPYRFGACVLVFALAVSGAAAQDAEHTVNVAELTWEGVSAVSRKELAEAIVTRGPSWYPWAADVPFDQAALDEDMERIAAFYREYGYFDAEPSYTLEWNAERSEVRIQIAVEQGMAVILERVEVEQVGGGHLDEDIWLRLVDELPFEVDRSFGVANYRVAREQFMQSLAEVGHPSPVLEGGADIDVATLSARVVWKVDPGPRVIFGQIEIVGLDDVADHIVRRELVFAPGDTYSLGAQRKSQEQLIELGLFRVVTIEPVPPPAQEPNAGAEAGERSETQVWPMRVRLEERPPRTLRVGIGYGTEERIRARVNWRHRNFLGEARQLDVRAQYNSLVSGLDVRLLQSHFLRPDQQLDASGFIRYETVPAYDALRTAVGFTVFRDLNPLWVARAGPEFELANVFEDSADRPEAEGESRVSSIRLGLGRNQLDDLENTTRGTSLDLSLDSALRAIGSSENFLTFGSEIRGYLPLWWTTVLASRFQIMAIQPVLGSDDAGVPVYKRLYVGGSTTVRGFKYQELGPLDADGNPLGGLSAAVASVELRFPIWKRLRGVAFFDAGVVDLRPFRYPIDEIQTSAGPGIRLATPIGSLRLDVGFPIDPDPGQDSYRIHLSVGQAF